MKYPNVTECSKRNCPNWNNKIGCRAIPKEGFIILKWYIMTLKEGKCDSCNEEVGFLFPIAVIQELPSGGEEMIVKYYCKDCYDIMLDAAQDEIDDREEEEEEEEEQEGNYS